MIIQFTFKKVCGNPKFYPDNAAAMALCAMCERVCLGDKQFIHVLKLRKLGAQVSVSNESGEALTGAQIVEILGL